MSTTTFRKARKILIGARASVSVSVEEELSSTVAIYRKGEESTLSVLHLKRRQLKSCSFGVSVRASGKTITAVYCQKVKQQQNSDRKTAAVEWWPKRQCGISTDNNSSRQQQQHSSSVSWDKDSPRRISDKERRGKSLSTSDIIMSGCGSIPKMTLWYYPMYRSLRPAWLINELGLSEQVDYKYLPMETPTNPERDEYTKTVHPHNTIPALQIEGRPTMLESTAICLYLAELGGRLAPEPRDRAEYYDWMLYAGNRLDEAMQTLTMQWWPGQQESQDQQLIADNLKIVETCLDRAEAALKDSPYILGKELTAVDCVLGYNMWWADQAEMKAGQLLQGRPHCQAYLARITARPALQAAMALPGVQAAQP